MPHRFLRKALATGFTFPPAGCYGAGAVFLPADRARARASAPHLRAHRRRGRADAAGLAPRAGRGRASRRRGCDRDAPVIEQVFIAASPAVRDAVERDPMAFERTLYVIRKRVEHAVDALPAADRQRFYIPSLSSRTLIYKGMLTAAQIQPTFPDLADPDMESALALVHQRFSTNTFPSWPLAHPYRSSPTTAKSTRCAATSTGCRRARACCARRCSATICGSCCRSSARGAATRRRSTTCSSCSSWPAARCRTRS